MRTTHQELAHVGLTVIGDEIVPMTTPDATWDMESLTAYAKRELSESILLAKRSTVHLFRAGHALSVVREKLKPEKEWVKWQQDNSLPRSTVNDAIRLFERAGSEEAVEGLPVMAAYDKFDIPKRGKNVADDEDAQLAGDENATSDELAYSSEWRSANDNTPVPDADHKVAAPLEQAETEEIRAYQAALRQPSLLTRATAIRNALEFLVDDLMDGFDAENELETLLDQIVDYASAARGLMHEQALEV